MTTPLSIAQKPDSEWQSFVASIDELIRTTEDPKVKAGAEAYKNYLLYLRDLLSGGTSPLDVIKQRMRQLGLRDKDLVPFVGSKSATSQLLNGKARLSMVAATRLVKHLGIPAELLVADDDIDQVLRPRLNFSQMPLNKIVERANQIGLNWSLPAKWKGSEQECILDWLKPYGSTAVLPTSPVLPKENSANRTNAKMDVDAFNAWVMLATAKAKTLPLKPYNEDLLTESFVHHLVKLSRFGGKCLSLVQEALADIGIALVFVPHFPKTYVDGACFRLNDKTATPVVALSLRYDRIDNFFFSLCHELGHLKYHLKDKGEFMVDDHTLRGSTTNMPYEEQADEFAKRCLFPEDSFSAFLNSSPSIEQAKAWAQRLGIAPEIVAGALAYHEKNWRRWRSLTPTAGLREVVFTTGGANS